MNRIKQIRIYFIFALLLIGYYAYSAWNGMGFWESKVIKDTEYNSNSHIRGARGFYHK